MNCSGVFFFISSLLGLNFTSKGLATKASIISFQTAIVAYGFYMIICKRIPAYREKTTYNIFFMIDAFQLELIYALQLFFVCRALWMRKLQEKIRKSLSTTNDHIAERKFLINFSILLIARMLKVVLVEHAGIRIYMLRVLFAELVFASSDFMFSFYIFQSIASLRNVRANLLNENDQQAVKDAKLEVLKQLWTKRDIETRYSLELLITITYNFTHLIISLYFFCMRIQFDLLKSVDGKKTLTMKNSLSSHSPQI